jgi:hypothetical protein
MSNTAFHELKKTFSKRHQQAVDKVVGISPAVTNVAQSAHGAVKSTINKTTAVIASSVSTGLLAGSLILGPAPTLAQITSAKSLPSPKLSDTPTPTPPILGKTGMARLLTELLPTNPQNLTDDQNNSVERIVKQALNLKVGATLDGKALNTTYGYMGAEQHLPRFPGDTVGDHDFNQKSGITPKTGAWGYFTDSREKLTPEIIAKEKYYFAVQTFLAPGWRENSYQLKDWFRHRKMIAVNPKTGDAVVGVIADAGPAVWTRKHFGGSPEVMSELKLNKGMQNGAVLLYFVDDPENKIPLGPITLE